ncbi:MAG: fumarate reductase subunit D, partial [Thiopseudomonas sp.]|nr:fumarate reductase subunit D [Thiopseudomonas sp.]
MQQEKKFKRSDEPIWWGLFSGGGVCFAVFLPSVILFYGLLLPLGVVTLEYQQASAWFFSFWGLVFVGAVIALP